MLQGGVPVQTVSDAILDSMNMNSIPAQFTSSTIIVWAIDAMKRSDRFLWLSKETTRLNQLAAVLGAAITSVGIHFVLEPTSTAGVYTFTITGLSVVAIAHFLSGFLMSLVGQHTILKGYQAVNVLREIASALASNKQVLREVVNATKEKGENQ